MSSACEVLYNLVLMFCIAYIVPRNVNAMHTFAVENIECGVGLRNEEDGKLRKE